LVTNVGHELKSITHRGRLLIQSLIKNKSMSIGKCFTLYCKYVCCQQTFAFIKSRQTNCSNITVA